MEKILNLLNTRIILSCATILAALTLVAGATYAFFSDTEVSADNTFTSGSIDLKIENTSYALDFNIPNFPSPTGVMVANPANTWTSNDLTIEKFFKFTDLKPGDYGEDTISAKIGSNDTWLCAAVRVTSDADNSITDSEDPDDSTTDGDLDNALNLIFWRDDGDNVLETDEESSLFANGFLSNLNPEGKIILADSTGGSFGPGPIPGNSTAYIGKGWCFGALTLDALPQDGINTGNPITRSSTGFICNGSDVNNAAQTDSIVGDMQFIAVQARNNTQFTCNDWIPVWNTTQTP